MGDVNLNQPAVTIPTPSDARRLWAAAISLGAFAAATWLAFLGWDHEYYTVDGIAQGPYRAWQVLGCGAAISLATVVAYLCVRRAGSSWVLAAAATVGIAVPWAVDAAATDDSGMWLVGLVLLTVGAGTGLIALLAICRILLTIGTMIGRGRS